MEYKECAEFRKLVQEKKLPPIRERLPEEPFIVTVKEIGHYGGIWRQAHLGVIDLADCLRIIREPLVVYDTSFTCIKPNIVRAWQWNKDITQLVLYLRKGIKWSDGKPFTADDLLFWYEDIALNKELTPIPPSWLKVDGKIGKLEKLDVYTVRWTFPKPNGFFLEHLASVWNLTYAPKHYLQQFHPRYTPLEKIEAMRKKENYDTWSAFFSAKNAQFNNPELPGIEAWISKTKLDAPVHRLERNPYYWKVDQAGNQLPYLDRIDRYFVPSPDAVLLRALSGEIDVQQRRLADMNNYPILVEHQQQGNYRIQLFPTPESNFSTIFFNYHIQDKFLRTLFWNKQFRRALSLAINRDEINQLFFKGTFYPSQNFPGKGTPWYMPEYNNRDIEYNPKEANRILDELGLTKRDREGYRLRPDGKRLFLINDVFASWFLNMEVQDMVKEYWRDIGIQVIPRPVATSLWVTRVAGAQFQLATYMSFNGSYGVDPILQPFVYPISSSSYWGPLWGLWFATDGKAGEEPPPPVKELMVIRDKVRAEPNMDKRIALNKLAFKIRAENLWDIGIVNEPPLSTGRFLVIHNTMRNVPETGLYDGNFIYYHPASWFKINQLKN
ncbi:MAG: ABC transporter substrate-binding protein [bacterium]|nr:ABC transporter substrate-binding protein [bacterium]